jgi:hypothetical protein
MHLLSIITPNNCVQTQSQQLSHLSRSPISVIVALPCLKERATRAVDNGEHLRRPCSAMRSGNHLTSFALRRLVRRFTLGAVASWRCVPVAAGSNPHQHPHVNLRYIVRVPEQAHVVTAQVRKTEQSTVQVSTRSALADVHFATTWTKKLLVKARWAPPSWHFRSQSRRHAPARVLG